LKRQSCDKLFVHMHFLFIHAEDVDVMRETTRIS
jgi:hypothetical protein